MEDAKCRICRRAGTKLFLKGEKCLSPKCPMIRKPYPPGQRAKRRSRALSGYGKGLRERQKLQRWYGLRERQFKKYVQEALSKRGKEDASNLLIGKLETRLDNLVFRFGFASSRAQARQLVSHNHFLVNGHRVNIPSYQAKKGDKIKVKDGSRKKIIFSNLPLTLKKYQPPSWLKLDVEKLEGEIVGESSSEEINSPVEISSIFEYYSG